LRRAGGTGGLLLGVDGGNTKTIALAARRDCTVVGEASGGRADIHNATTPEAGVDEVARVAAAALQEAAASVDDLDSVVFSLAGADWPEDFDFLRQGLAERLGLDVEPVVVNDAIGALRAGTDDGAGVAVVCGTGGAIGARNRAGEIYHLGFWPDSTGANALGAEALASVWRAALGIAPETTLTARALERWGAADPIELLHAFTRLGEGRIPAPERALFAETVLDEAAAGDAVAAGIVRLTGTRLGDYARFCAGKTGQLGSPFPLVLCGGVLRHPSALLRESILARLPDAEAVYPEVEPVVGALLLAADRVGTAPSLAELLERGRGLAAGSILASPSDETGRR
jgi:N-acetylglucosamine kinase-like BadF-type ATPase